MRSTALKQTQRHVATLGRSHSSIDRATLPGPLLCLYHPLSVSLSSFPPSASVSLKLCHSFISVTLFLLNPFLDSLDLSVSLFLSLRLGHRVSFSFSLSSSFFTLQVHLAPLPSFLFIPCSRTLSLPRFILLFPFFRSLFSRLLSRFGASTATTASTTTTMMTTPDSSPSFTNTARGPTAVSPYQPGSCPRRRD